MATAKQLAALKKGREAMAKKRAAGTVKKRAKKVVKSVKKVVKSDTFAIRLKLGEQTAYLKDKNLKKFDTDIKAALILTKTQAKNLVDKLNKKHGDKGEVSFRIVAVK